MIKYSGVATSFALSLALGGAILSSMGCTPKQDDVWDQKPSERQEAVLQQLKSDLASSPEGWILELRPDKDFNYGGYLIGLKFDANGQVLATSEALENPDKTSNKVLLSAQRSEYTLAKDDRLVLSFDVNNDAIHYYSRPDTDLGAGRSKGFLGDFRFKVISSSTDTIHLEGQKTRNRMVMYRAPQNIEAYMTSIIIQKRQLFSLSSLRAARQDSLEYRLTDGGEVVELLDVGEVSYNIYKGKDKAGKKVSHPFFVTPTGIRFVDKDGTPKDFTWDATNSKLVAADGSNITGRPDPSYPKYAAYLGSYACTYRDARGEHSANVTIEESGYKTYVIKGLSYDIQATYNSRTDRFEIALPHQINGLQEGVSWIGMTPDFRGEWGGGLKLYPSYIKGSNPKKYKLIGSKKNIVGLGMLNIQTREWANDVPNFFYGLDITLTKN